MVKKPFVKSKPNATFVRITLKLPTLLTMWINLLGFKFIWLGLVFLGDVFIPIALILLLLHLCYCCNKKAEFQLVIWVTAIGIIIDSLLIFVGFFNFEHAAHLPYWLLALWVCFAATVSQGMSFLKGKVLWQILIGALFAPISYLTGSNLSLINFEYSTVASFLVLSLIWGPLMAIIFLLERKFYQAEVQHA